MQYRRVYCLWYEFDDPCPKSQPFQHSAVVQLGSQLAKLLESKTDPPGQIVRRIYEEDHVVLWVGGISNLGSVIARPREDIGLTRRVLQDGLGRPRLSQPGK